MEQVKWNLRLEGKSYGPFLTAELAAGLSAQEFRPLDLISLQGKNDWHPIQGFPEFAELCSAQGASAYDLPAPPPVRSLWLNRRTPPPIPTVIPKAPTEKVVLQKVARQEIVPQEVKEAKVEETPPEATSSGGLPERPSFQKNAQPKKQNAKNSARQTIALAQMAHDWQQQQKIAKIETAAPEVALRPEKKKKKFVSAFILLALLTSITAGAFLFPKITRGLKGFLHPSDPYNPSTLNSADSNPIYLPKAPVRPKR